MGVKKLAGRGKGKGKGKAKHKKVLKLSLPTEDILPERDIRKYCFLIYARAGWGKTALASTFPGTLFFATEAGTKGIRRREFNHDDGGCHSWEIIEEGVRLLERDKSPTFKNVAIDTVRRAYDMCSDAYCEETGIEQPGETVDGKKDWGKSFRDIAAKFADLLNRILATGRGLLLLAHAKEIELTDPDGGKHDFVQPNLSNSALTLLTAFVDFGFFGDMILDSNGDNARVLITEGNEGMWGKHREMEGITFPRILPIPDKMSGYRVVRSAFLGKEEHVHIKLGDLRTGVLTSKAMAGMLSSERMAAGRRRLRKGGKKVVKRKG